MNGISLGEDLETEILVRLPAKSLMRFKSVQQSWNVLFKTPTFVMRHMHMHMSEDRSLMFLHSEKHDIMKPCIWLLDNPTPTHGLISSRFLNNSIERVLSYGHCNGVFCLCLEGSDDQFILWNPSTREVHQIPQPPSHALASMCGFGADPNTNHFKVVHLNIYYSNRITCLSSADIYNLSTKGWIPIHGLALPHHTRFTWRRWTSKYNTLVNGVYHWITGSTRDGVANILCFDFRNNKFHNLKAPVTDNDFLWGDIAEVNCSLAYVVEYQHCSSLGIWVMDQHGWAKKYSIGPFEPTVRIRGLWKDGAQVLGGKVGQPLTSYDHDGNSVRQFQFDLVCGCRFILHDYVQSIAPLST